MNSIDEIVELYKRDVDVTLMDAWLRLRSKRESALSKSSSASVKSCARRWSANMTRFADLLARLR
jgi:hypothetical protein